MASVRVVVAKTPCLQGNLVSSCFRPLYELSCLVSSQNNRHHYRRHAHRRTAVCLLYLALLCWSFLDNTRPDNLTTAWCHVSVLQWHNNVPAPLISRPRLHTALSGAHIFIFTLHLLGPFAIETLSGSHTRASQTDETTHGQAPATLISSTLVRSLHSSSLQAPPWPGSTARPLPGLTGSAARVTLQEANHVAAPETTGRRRCSYTPCTCSSARCTVSDHRR